MRGRDAAGQSRVVAWARAAERDWYRSEALRLDAFCSALKNDVEYMRDKLAALEDDRAWLETQLKASKRSITLMKSELSSTLSVAPTDPSGVAGVSTPSGRRRTPSASLGRVVSPNDSATLDAFDMVSASASASDVPADVAATTGVAGVEPASTRPAASKARRHHEALALASGMDSDAGDAARVSRSGAAPPPSMLVGTHAASKTSLDAREASLRAPVTESKQEREKEAGASTALVRQLRGQLSTTHKQMETLRTKNERLKAANTALRSSRGELETFFLQCIEDVRKEVARRRVRSVAASAAASAVPATSLGLAGTQSTPALHAGGGTTTRSAAMPAQLHATAVESALARGAGVDAAVAVARAKTVGLTDFTATDRRAVVSRLLEDEYVLQALHDVIFARAADTDAGDAPPLPDAPLSPGAPQEHADTDAAQAAEALDSTRVLMSPTHVSVARDARYPRHAAF